MKEDIINKGLKFYTYLGSKSKKQHIYFNRLTRDVISKCGTIK